jgi:iron complex transport system ATP-binding protein
MTSAVEVSGLSISLGERSFAARVLDGVSFSLARGAFLSIVGRNGAGKSTLFRCIAGICKGYGGEIRVDGKPVSEMRQRERARHIAYVPQSAPADVPYTVEAFMEMSRYPWRHVASASDDRRAIDEAMSLAGVSDLAGRRLGELSGGERQKVLIASAVAQGASCVLMDEPTTYLDYAHQVEAMRIMAAVNRERGATMLVVTHDVNMAIRISSRVAAMSDGRIVWDGTPGAFVESGRLEEIYGVPFERYRAEDGARPPLLAPAADLGGVGR